MPKFDNQTIQLVIVVAVAVALAIQTIALLAALLVMRKLAKSVQKDIEQVRGTVMPLIADVRELVTRVKPRIEEATLDITVLIHSLREQTADVQSVADDVIARARRQASRIDSMFSGVLDTVDRASTFMADTVAKPMRQLSAFLASAKAVVEALRSTDGGNHAGASRAAAEDDPYA
jgi:signal transduction histidine kinase